jgi:polysaccharide deacetylase family protein (PEP-CTERM system associated)
MPAPVMRNALTIDVEDYFHAAAFADCIPRSRWSAQPCRVEANVERVLALLGASNVRATFFVLGWIARRYPDLVRAIAAAGHELGSHGYTHQSAAQLTRVQFIRDILRSKGVLEDLTGKAVLGYRAPECSIAPASRWALDALFQHGYRYSSSSYPIRPGDAGDPLATRFATFPAGVGGILELPLATVRLGGRNIPAGGAQHFRLYPYGLSRWLLRRVNRLDRQPAIFHIRPWDLDLGQPRHAALGVAAQIHQYVNLDRMEARLQALLRDFQWDRIDQIFPVLPSSRPVLHSE